MHPIRAWLRRQVADPQVVTLLLVLVAIWALLTFFTSTFAPVLAAVIIAYLLERPVAAAERLAPRWLASLLVWLLFVALGVVAVGLLVPVLTRQITQLLTEVPSVIRSLQAWIFTLPELYPALFSAEQARDLAAGIHIDVNHIRTQVLARSHLLGTGVTLLVVYGILVPFMVLFLLKDKSAVLQWLRGFLPGNASLLHRVWIDVDQQIAGYVRGKVIEIAIVWVTTYVTFALLGLNYAALLGAITGLSVLIPWVGATVVTLPVAIVAYAQFGIGAEFAWVLVAYGVIQALDGNVLVPLIFSETNNLHPVAIIVAVLFFGTQYGFWGVFFAIPLATVVAAVLKAWPRVHADAAAG
jgi:putative permease